MYCQLGTTIFDGYKSFVSFSQEEEAVLVEHALIGRKPRLEGAGLGLRTITISIFLHQEFCVVDDEIAKLRASKDSFEILTLLWGNGKIEGQFVIKQMDTDITQQDAIGNNYAATVNFILKESVNDNQLDQKQQQAQQNATAVGNKKPATKSKRKNSPTCSQQVSQYIDNVKSHGYMVDFHLKGYTGQPLESYQIRNYCKAILADTKSLVLATNDSASCIYNNTGIRNNAVSVQSYAASVGDDVTGSTPNISAANSDNASLQSAILALVKASSQIVQKAVIPQ